MKHSFTLLAMLFTGMLSIIGTATASAQWSVGVDGGVTINSLHTGQSYDYDRHYDSRGSFTVGIPVRYDFNDWFGLQTEVSVMQKNYSMHRSPTYKYFYYDYSNTYLDLPVMARFSFGGKKLRGYLLAGFYLGAWLDSHVEGSDRQYFGGLNGAEYISFDTDVEFDSRRDNRFDGGLVGGVGLQYSITRRIGLFAEARYYYGLSDLQKNYMRGRQPRYNNTVAVMLGVMYTFGK